MNLVSAYPKSVNPGIPVNSPTPKGWSKVTYGDFLYEVQRPIQLEDKEYYQLVTVKRSRGGVVVRSMLKGVEVKTPRQFLIREGDLLISKRQIVHGACGIVPVELSGSIVSSEYSILNSRPELNLDFFNHFTHTAYFQQTCFHSSVGVHVEKMIFKVDEWFEWDFNLPPLLEQCKIAEVLGVWDESVDLLEKLIGRVRSRKQGLMQQLLTGKKRFKEFEDSEWKISRIGSFVKVQGGFAFKSENFSDSGIHVIRISNIQSCDVDLTSTLFHQFDPKLTQYEINHGDILIAMSGATTGKVGKYQEHHKSYLNQRVGRFTALDKTKVSMNFVFQIVRSNKFQHLIMIDATGGAQPNISSLDIENIVLKFPPLPEQEKIAAVLSAADDEISTLEKQLAAYKQQKLGLMQQLLTGRIRI